MVLRSDEPELFHYPEGQLIRLLHRSPSAEGADTPETVWARLTSLLLLDR